MFSVSGTIKSNGQNFLSNMCTKHTSHNKSLWAGFRPREVWHSLVQSAPILEPFLCVNRPIIFFKFFRFEHFLRSQFFFWDRRSHGPVDFVCLNKDLPIRREYELKLFSLDVKDQENNKFSVFTKNVKNSFLCANFYFNASIDARKSQGPADTIHTRGTYEVWKLFCLEENGGGSSYPVAQLTPVSPTDGTL